MFAYFRKTILLYAKCSNVDVYTFYEKYSQKDASEYTLVLFSALIFLSVWMSRFLKSSLMSFLVLFICLFVFILYCKFSSKLPVSMNWFFLTELNGFTGKSVMWEHPSWDWLMQADVIFRLQYLIFVMVIYAIYLTLPAAERLE